MDLMHSSGETLAVFLNLHILIPCCSGNVRGGTVPRPPQGTITAFFTAPQPPVPGPTNRSAALAHLGRQGRPGGTGEQDCTATVRLPGAGGVQCHHPVWGWARKRGRSYCPHSIIHGRAMPVPEKNPIHVHPRILAPSALGVLSCAHLDLPGKKMKKKKKTEREKTPPQP